MASQPTITAIVPAYNEAERIGPVLDILTTYPHFSEIIVVDDGSTDATRDIAQSYPVRLIRNPSNIGKGFAMDRGVQAAQGNIIFFCDADIKGLTHNIIKETLTPVVRREVEMCIAMCNRKLYPVPFAGRATRDWHTARFHLLHAFIPLLSGERAITKHLWQTLPDYYKYQFRIEAALNFYAKHYGRGYQYKVFPGLQQTIKEKKYGFWEGLRRRGGFVINFFEAYGSLRTEALKKVLG